MYICTISIFVRTNIRTIISIIYGGFTFVDAFWCMNVMMYLYIGVIWCWCANPVLIHVRVPGVDVLCLASGTWTTSCTVFGLSGPATLKASSPTAHHSIPSSSCCSTSLWGVRCLGDSSTTPSSQPLCWSTTSGGFRFGGSFWSFWGSFWG